MRSSVKMVFDDPSKFGLLATQVKLGVIKAGQAAVNQMAGRARKEAQKNIRKGFTNRNAFTAGQVQYTPSHETKYTKITAIQSFVGITERASYMARQETGGQRTPSKGDTLAIPTAAARGGSDRNPVASSMRVPRLRSKRISSKKGKRRRRPNFVSDKAKIVAKVYMAHKLNKLVSLRRFKSLTAATEDDRTNLYRVKQFIKRGRDGVAFELERVYTFDTPETRTDPQPWLFPASDKVARQSQAIFNAQMKKLGL